MLHLSQMDEDAKREIKVEPGDTLFAKRDSDRLKLLSQLEKIECKVCSAVSSLFWREVGVRVFVCNDCFQNKRHFELYKGLERKKSDNEQEAAAAVVVQASRPAVTGASKKQANNSIKNSKVTTRRFNQQQMAQRQTSSSVDDASSVSSVSTTSGTNRRSALFKRFKPKKLEAVDCTVNTNEFVFHRGVYLQIDDIVCLRDAADTDTSRVYYAQIRGFLIDQFTNKSAVLTWLLPTSVTNRAKFDENEYVLGPDEEFPRSLDCMQFVCRPKVSYFKRRHVLYDTGVVNQPGNCYTKDKNCLNRISLYKLSLANNDTTEELRRIEFCE